MTRRERRPCPICGRLCAVHSGTGNLWHHTNTVTGESCAGSYSLRDGTTRDALYLRLAAEQAERAIAYSIECNGMDFDAPSAAERDPLPASMLRAPEFALDEPDPLPSAGPYSGVCEDCGWTSPGRKREYESEQDFDDHRCEPTALEQETR